MMSKNAHLPLLLLACLVGAPAAAVAETSKWEWQDVSRVVALGDVHGAFDKMVSLVRGTGLVDADLKWVGGDQHLVLCGDLVNRGDRDRAVLDLARRLQQEAAAAGGRVHVLLGNHEVMNLTRDFRYVSRASFAQFAADEKPRERKRALRSFRERFQDQENGDEEIERAFDELYPPGYFARTRAFAPDGAYGVWLLAQPTAIKVDGVLFVHGGLTAEVAALGLDEINRRMSASVRAFVAGGEVLASLIRGPADFSAIVLAATKVTESVGEAESAVPEVAAARTVLEELEGGLPFTPGGPAWYRGSAVENERLERQGVARVLELLGARAEVVGHTPTRSGRVTSRFNGRLYRADVGMGYGREALALALEGEKVLVFDPATLAYAPPMLEPPQGEGWPGGEEDLADGVLESFLRQAEVTASSSLEIEDVPVRILELEMDGMRLRAVFGFARETAEEAAADGRKARRRYQHQAAAYRLDRRLGLDMVPVTVIREVAGTEGIVQIWIQAALDLPAIEAYGGHAMFEGLEPQIARAGAFSALIGLEERLDAGKMLLPVSRRVLIADNGVAFPVDPDAARYLPAGCGPVGPAFMNALRALGREELAADLGDLLSEPQIDALLARRNALVELCEKPAAGWSIDRMLAR